MWVLSASDKWTVDFRRALLPGSLGLLLAIHLLFRPPLLLMLLLCALLPLYLVIERLLATQALQKLDREFSLLLTRQDIEGLKRLVKRAWWLRWFGPSGVLEEKKGLLALAEQNWDEANHQLEQAHARLDGRQRQRLLPPLLRARFEAGMWAEAEEIGRKLVGRGPFPTSAELFLGLILCRRPEERQEGIRLLRRARDTLGPEDRARAVKALEELEQEG
ncbi:MAG: hypothetical protein JW797_01110 [Bradymonadales bacterium]|nr:hypothetical protein [Bradymonadales bacterium]